MPKSKQKIQIDPITIATIWHYLQRICVDMRETMERTATNVLATSLHDLAYGIWDADTRAIAIPEGFPSRLISSTYPIKAVKSQFDGKIYPGDVFLTNHPFKAGAVHLPDWVFIRPTFYEGELAFFTCMGTHVPDNGGAQPGTHFLAKDSVAEGLNIPPLKVVEKGQARNDVLELILSNNRLPEMMRREIQSLIGSTAVAEQRLIELLKKYGKETVFACIDEMIRRTEKAVRAEISKWPEGTYCSEAQTDDDGKELDVPVTVRCELTIKGDRAVFDFSKSDDQRQGYINAVYPMTLSGVLCTVFLFLGTDLSAYHNEGSLHPIEVIAREGSVVNARPGALTAAAPGVTGALIVECVLSAMSQALPERAIAPYARLVGPGQKIGTDTRTNKLYIYTSWGATGGAGAVYGYDGYQCCCDLATLGVVSKTDAEEEMVRFPWRVKTYEFLTDSPGAGRWRGAPGIQWEGINEGGDCFTLGGASSGWRIPSKGQQGGYPTPLNSYYIQRGKQRIPIKNPHVAYDLKNGDALVSKGGGGAGVGPPEERDPEAVRMDVKNELVSLEAAREVYKVVLSPKTLRINYPATQKLRSGSTEK